MKNRKIREHSNFFKLTHIPNPYIYYLGLSNNFKLLSLRHFPPLSTTKAQKLGRMTWTENTCIYRYVCGCVCVIFPVTRKFQEWQWETSKMSQLFLGGHFHLSDMIIKIKHAWVGNCLIKNFHTSKARKI